MDSERLVGPHELLKLVNTCTCTSQLLISTVESLLLDTTSSKKSTYNTTSHAGVSRILSQEPLR